MERPLTSTLADFCIWIIFTVLFTQKIPFHVAVGLFTFALTALFQYCTRKRLEEFKPFNAILGIVMFFLSICPDSEIIIVGVIALDAVTLVFLILNSFRKQDMHTTS